MSDTRLEIVLAAYSALKSDGLPVLSYDRIAEEADMSRQVIRYHFADADDLMIALCDHLAGVYRDTLIENAKDLTGPLRIDMFLDFYFGTLEGQKKPEDDQVYDALMSRAAASEDVRQSLRNQYGLLGQVLSHELQLAFPDLERQAADELSYAFVALMYGHWKMVASLGFSADHNHISRAAMSRLIRASVADKSPDFPKINVWSVSPQE